MYPEREEIDGVTHAYKTIMEKKFFGSRTSIFQKL